VKNDSVSERTVNLGRAFGEMSEIITGIKAGDRVVINPPDRIKNNSKIKIIER
jgi:multidrug efflux pump subunit AcrA (membrane-fusion protein)